MLVRVILLAMLFTVGVYGQEQDRPMMDRIMKPDMELSNSMSGKVFDGGGFATKKYDAGKGYGGVKQAQSKTFATRSFFGIRNPWFGKKVYETSAAYELTRYVLSDKSFGSRDVKTKAAWDSERASKDSERNIATRSFLGKGKKQDALDKESAEKQKKLSIDEVREILNRNR